ncbi:MAG: zinc metalloprotease HtpX [Phycisphaeraceae bacterium]|nr:zinc metalloprotease HtpX [Phycisphaeraceae bacterium]
MNNLKTVILLGALFGLILAIGAQFGQRGLILALAFGGIMNIVAYFFSDKIAIASMRGQEVNEKSAPDLVHMVERLAENAGLPMPRVYVCPQEAPNAFATGRNPSRAAVAVTQGALRLLSYDELEGVMAHELAHVKNRDTLTSCVAATIAGAISFLGHMVWFMGLGGNNREEGSNPLVTILMLILAPIAAAVIQMAISRSREYVADADGARIAGTPHGLISALRKLEASAKRIPMQGEMATQNHMFIVQPLTGESFARLFSTHPSMESRVRRLMELA